MQVWFSIIPGHGHFFPMLPLARALRAAGHAVTFGTSASYGATVREHGFEAFTVGLNYTQSGIVSGPGDIDDLERAMFVDGPGELVHSYVDRFSKGHPDVVLVDPSDIGSPVAAEVAGVPWGVVLNGVIGGLHSGDLPFDLEERKAAMDRSNATSKLRAHFGLEPLDLLESERPYDRTLRLTMVPKSLAGWPLKWRSHTAHELRPEIHTSDSDDAWLADIPSGAPVVAVSLGTLFGTSELYRRTVEVVLGTGATVIAVTSFDLGIEHDHLITTSWVSMDRLMDRSDVLVHHGGWGSTIAALATGTPAVVIPLGADQFVNAARLDSIGAAISVDIEEIEDIVPRSIRAVIDDPTYRLNAARLAREIENMPPADDVVPIIERLGEEGPPQLNR
jgi:UDP:flavonoid glycosyltransferase YjiC (YdhE family)